MGLIRELKRLCIPPEEDEEFMMDDKKRFVIIYRQDSFGTEIRILQDTLTGVQYLYYSGSIGGGLTPLIDQAGHPIVTPVFREEDF